MSAEQGIVSLIALASCLGLLLAAVAVSIWWTVSGLRLRGWPDRRALIIGSICLAVPAVGLALCTLALDRLDPLNRTAFNSQIWKTCVKDSDFPRGGLTRSLLRDHLRPGMPKSEVLQLLGPPDMKGGGSSEHLRDEDKGLNRSVLVYDLGAWSGFRIDEDYLSIIFDRSDRMVAAFWWQS